MTGTCILTATGMYSCNMVMTETASLVAIWEIIAARQLVWLSMWSIWPVALFIMLKIWDRVR